jgi:hypothetical protein
MRRVFVDITTSLMLAGQQSTSLSRVEGEVAGRLLSSNLNFIPVVFRNDGLLFALSPAQVALIFSFKPAAGSQGNHPSKQASLTPSAKRAAALITDRKAPLQPSLPTRLRLVATATLRYAAAALVARASDTVRQDARAILIHFRRIVRSIIYGHPGSATSTPVSSILPTLQMVVYPRSGDVLWTAGLFGDFVPLRRIGEMRARSGLRVVTCCGVTHRQPSLSNMGDELFTADAVALLDASDLVLAICERTRHELLALAARSGRKPPTVQVLQVGEGLRRLLDLDDEESPKATIADTRTWPKLTIPGLDAPLWDELAATVKKPLQMLLADTDGE